MSEIIPSHVLKNGLVYTVDQDRSWAQALVISDGRIVYVGSNEGLEPFVSSSSDVIDLGGKMVLPGFSDAHALSATSRLCGA